MSLMREVMIELLKAARHVADCDFAGQSIEFRCAQCVTARAVMAKADRLLRKEGQ
jgi:hypothetical protein